MFPVDEFRTTLEKMVAIFQQHKIRFHLTGGITSVIYGEPRMTQDIDIVIDNQATAKTLDRFIASCEASGFLLDAPALQEAVSQKRMFQLFDTVEALKLDIYPRELIEGELNRSQIIEVFEGMRLPLVSRADAAASKLVWISKGSHKSRRDLRRIYLTGPDADQAAIRQFAAQHGLEELLNEVLSEPDEILE